MSILILPVLAGIAALFLAVKSYQNFKKLKYYPLVVVGSILTIIIGINDEVKNNQIRNEFTSEMEQFNLRLDTVESTPEIKQIATDYDQWVLNLPTELQIKKLRQDQKVNKLKTQELSDRSFTMYSFNCLKTSLKNYSIAFNKHFGNSFESYFQETDGLDNESIALLRGDKNTYYMEFKFDETKHLSKYTDGISFYTIPNDEFDQSMGNLNTKDTVEMAFVYASFKLSLLDYLRYSFQIDRASFLMKVFEYDGLWSKPTTLSNVFKTEYDLQQSPRHEIDLIAKELFEKILITEGLSLRK